MFWLGDEREKREFEKLYLERIGVLYKIAFSYFKNEDGASDALQDTALIAYRNFKNLKEKEKFNSWITTILVNRCREMLRKNKKVILEEIDSNIELSINSLKFKTKCEYSKVEDNLYIIDILNKIDIKYSEVIRLKYLGDYTLSEIAFILSIPLGTVKSRMSTGLKELRKLVEVKDSVM
jgi:RNA polymerase sigma factor, sigma-70 family